MKIAVFGASGRTGRPLVEQALEQGYEVVAFVRDPAKLNIKHERLQCVQGDVSDADAVERAVVGVDAVFSALGQGKNTAKDVQTVCTKNIIAAMKKHGVRRLVSLTGAGVADPQDEPKAVDKFITFLLRKLQPDVLRDAENHAQEIKGSDLDWTIVRGPRLTEGAKKGVYRVGFVGKNSGTQISRADVADFMLKQLSDTQYVRQMPMVSY